MKSSRSSETVSIPLDEIKPYWRNPRVIPEEAVEAVQQSIQEFGYVQPIVVDGKGVIVTGHTRHAGLRRLGAGEAEVSQGDTSDRQARARARSENASAAGT